MRCVLGYQETDDQVRSRFSVWAGHHIAERVTHYGLDAQVLMSFRALRHLIEGFC